MESAPPPPPNKNVLDELWIRVKAKIRKLKEHNEIEKTWDFHQSTFTIAEKRKEELEKRKAELEKELSETNVLLARTIDILRAFEPRERR